MRLFTVDAFTSEPFKGNPAGVCVLETALTEEQYLKIAQEINYAETAFVIKDGKGFNLRWFTPTVEVDLCGHATLATAKILFEKYNYSEEYLSFYTRSGELKVKKMEDGLLEMDFPAKETQPKTIDSVLQKFVGDTVLYYGEDGIWAFVEVEDATKLKKLLPQLNLLKAHSQKIFVITAKSLTSGIEYVSRVFAPNMGIDEDPVTGAAHCFLAHYWNTKLSKNPTRAQQVSARGGEMECELIANNRVLLRGDAVIMCELLVEWKM